MFNGPLLASGRGPIFGTDAILGREGSSVPSHQDSGFTLIELMIVIAIIAIIAAIAIPNLLESRVTSQETAAATALRTGILPAEVQYQAGGYMDSNGNGIGSYAVGATAYDQLSGGTSTITGITLNLLAPTYRGSSPVISNYVFQDPVTGTVAADDDERVWAVLVYPVDLNNGRRKFAINQVGRVYGTAPSTNAATSEDAFSVTVFGASLSSMPDSATWRPYSR